MGEISTKMIQINVVNGEWGMVNRITPVSGGSLVADFLLKHIGIIGS